MRTVFALIVLMIQTTTTLASEPVCEWQVHRRIDHDPSAFTQGLDIVDDVIYESTGLYGESTIRQLSLSSGEIIKKLSLEDRYFGEGLVALEDQLFVVTWREGTGMVFDRSSLELKRTFEYAGEGWGLTTDGESLIMSNGSADLQFLHLDTAAVTRTVEVMSEHGPVTQLNELEYVDNSIFANVWQSEAIVIIDPASGKVLGWLDMRGLLGPMKLPGVLNGIAAVPTAPADADGQRLLVTGKNWPAMFEIDVHCPFATD